MLEDLYDDVVPPDRLGWGYFLGRTMPLQTNSYDCGVFMCKGMEELVLGIGPPFTFLQKDMPDICKSMKRRLSTLVE